MTLRHQDFSDFSQNWNMPTFRNLLGIPRHTDDQGNLGPESPRSPRSPRSPMSARSPRSPRSPKSPGLSKTRQNPDYLNQCAGCDNVDTLLRRSLGGQKDGLGVVLHNSFAELNKCAHKCQICRVFRQSLVLEEVTFDGVHEVQQTQGAVMVRWKQTTAANGAHRTFLNVEIRGQPGHAGMVNCSSHKVGHLALRSNGLDTAVIQQAKGWLDTCIENHVGECGNLRWSSENPRLLIEVKSPAMVRLCEHHQGKYVALSYCWGDTQMFSKTEMDKVERGQTTLANLDLRREWFPMSDLPSTVQDALRIVHAMDIQYAWVDALCIVQDGPDKRKEVAKMHLVYSNALFTLMSCATTKATAKLLDQREAWTQTTELCRLGHQWLTTSDMSLNELRLRSPLAERAWTLQEERLSPRMLYVSSNRMYWSCAKGHEMEMRPIHGQEATPLQRPLYSASDRDTQMPRAQEFLLAIYNGKKDLHAFWADIVTSYALRSMGRLSDRLTALSGLAAKYLSADSRDAYLAGLWANNLAEGLAWRVNQAVETPTLNPKNLPPLLPSWSWAVLPLQTAIEINVKSLRLSDFEFMGDDGDNSARLGSTEDAVKRGEHVMKICVKSRMRPLRKPTSRRKDWSTISKIVNAEEKFSFASNPEQDMHAIDPATGRILVYEDRKREVIGQLDFQRDIQRVQWDQVHLWALELGTSTMLLLEHCDRDLWRRVGVAWDVREDFFALAQCSTVIIR
ncbi:HET-domain-containing protein [Ophiobolus disseminans]|uniref:HET-domain-containing protein n=1 Tax=Ophiobolus disseminans TaxID=1469910 RepID=A0A6A6ZIY9_9PLEO|nr:HET-domain-containing protein [Ophiobolus disseminans]